MIAGGLGRQRKVRTPQGKEVRNANQGRPWESATETYRRATGKGEMAR